MNTRFEAVDRERAILYTTRKISINLYLLDRKIGFVCCAKKENKVIINKVIEMVGYKAGTKILKKSLSFSKIKMQAKTSAKKMK